MEEVWKIVSYSEIINDKKIIFDNYEISTFGNIRRKDNKKPINSNQQNENYPRIGFSKNGKKSKTVYLHVLIAQEFLKNSNNYTDIRHKDGNIKNNNINNLEYKEGKFSSGIKFIFTFNNEEIINDEKWKNIIVNDKLTKYKISDMGNFKNYRGMITSGYSTKEKGEYKFVNISFNKIDRPTRVHRLVAQAFCEVPEKYKEWSYEDLSVDHDDGNKINNMAINLKWGNRSDNNNNENTKQYLSIYKIKKINYDIIEEFKSVDEAAEKNGVNQSAISQALIDFTDMHNSKKRVIESCGVLWCKKDEYNKKIIQEWYENALNSKEKNMKNERKRCNLDTDEQKNNRQKLLEREEELECEIIDKNDILNNILNDNTIIKFNCKHGHNNEKKFKLFKDSRCAECSGKKPNTFEKLNNELIPGINLKIISLNPDFKEDKPSTKKKCYLFECVNCNMQYKDTSIENLRNYIKRNSKYCKCT
jgi:hypothetical protein